MENNKTTEKDTQNKKLHPIAEKFGNKFAELFDDQSIVTLVMTGCMVGLLFGGVEPSKEALALFCTGYGSILTYFFTNKKKDKEV